MENSIKESFQRVKSDVEFLKTELKFLREELIATRNRMIEICDILNNLNKKISQQGSIKQDISTENETEASTNQQINPTDRRINPTDRQVFEPRKAQNLPFSIGNEGVPTDRQTNQQTNQQTQIVGKIQENSVEKAINILDSLDSIKKEIRLKFKRLTEQEFLVFSTIYQQEEETGFTNYKMIADKLNLTESSIRDYVGRLIKKGISVDKIKLNNKNIQLKVSQNLRKIVSLPTILQLRDL